MLACVQAEVGHAVSLHRTNLHEGRTRKCRHRPVAAGDARASKGCSAKGDMRRCGHRTSSARVAVNSAAIGAGTAVVRTHGKRQQADVRSLNWHAPVVAEVGLDSYAVESARALVG